MAGGDGVCRTGARSAAHRLAAQRVMRRPQSNRLLLLLLLRSLPSLSERYEASFAQLGITVADHPILVVKMGCKTADATETDFFNLHLTWCLKIH